MKAALLISLMIFAIPAAAQPALSLWIDDDGTLVDDYDVQVSVTFEVVVRLDSDGHDLSLVDWGMTELATVAPGLFNLGMNSPIGSCGFIPENCFEGNYSIFVNGCHPPGAGIEVIRISYADFTGAAGPDIVATIGPNGFGGIPSSPGFVDCSDVGFAAPMDGPSGGETSSGVVWPPGGLILNPTRPIPVEPTTVSMLKSRY
jgi:hypothetical protein